MQHVKFVMKGGAVIKNDLAMAPGHDDVVQIVPSSGCPILAPFARVGLVFINREFSVRTKVPTLAKGARMGTQVSSR